MPGSLRKSLYVTRRLLRYLVLVAVTLSPFLALSQTPDSEHCEDVVRRIEQDTAEVFDIPVADEYIVGDVQLYVSMSRATEIRLSSPSGTTIEINSGDGFGYPAEPIFSRRRDCTFSDYGVGYWDVRRNCRCLIDPPAYLGPGLRAGSFADLSGESAKGTWVLTFDRLNSGSDEEYLLNRWCVRLFQEVHALPVADLVCEYLGAGDVSVSWTNAGDYDSIDVYVHGDLHETLMGPFDEGYSESYTVRGLALPQLAIIDLVPNTDSIGDGHPRRCRVPLLIEALLEECTEPDLEYSRDDPAVSVLDITESVVIADLTAETRMSWDISGVAMAVTLTSPTGTEVTLSDSCGAGEDGCVNDFAGGPSYVRHITFWELGREYGGRWTQNELMQTHGSGRLADYFGEDAEGEWTLEVQPHGVFDCYGCLLESWCLRFYDQTPAVAVAGLSCTPGAESGAFDLAWENAAGYDELRVYLDDELVETLPGPFEKGTTSGTAVVIAPYPSYGWLCIIGVISDAPGAPACCELRTQALGALSCTSVEGSGVVDLAWTDFIDFDEVRVYVNETLEATLGGTAEAYSTVPREIPSNVRIRVEGQVDDDIASAACELPLLAVPRLELCDRVDAEIPGDTVAIFELAVTESFSVRDVEVRIDMGGGAIAGTLLTLESPEGTHVALHRASPATVAPRLIYGDGGRWIGDATGFDCECLALPGGPGDFADLAGEGSAGTWRLIVTNDYVLPAPATLLEWCLRLHEGCTAASPEDFACVEDGIAVDLLWTNPVRYDEISVFRHARRITSLEGSATAYRDDAAPSGFVEYRIVGYRDDLGCGSASARCALEHGRLERICAEGLPVAADSAGVFLEVSEFGRIAEVELQLDYTSDLRNTGHFVELTSPLGTTLVLLGQELNEDYDFDVIWSDRGEHFDLARVTLGERLRLPWPKDLSVFGGEEADVGFVWGLELAVAGDTAAVLEEACLLLYEDLCLLDPPAAFSCAVTGDEVAFSWSGGSRYDALELRANDTPVVRLAGDAESFLWSDIQVGFYRFELVGLRDGDGCRTKPALCEAAIGAVATCTVPSLVVESGATVSDAISLSGNTAVQELELRLDLTGESIGRRVSVTSPSGTAVVLHDRRSTPGGIDVTYSDHGRPNTGILVPDFGCECRIRPEGPGAMADFEGEAAGGDWTLAVENDMDAPAGILIEWCLDLYEACGVEPPEALECGVAAGAIELEWTNGAEYDAVEILRDGVPVATLAGGETAYTDVPAAPGRYAYRVAGRSDDLGCAGRSEACEVALGALAECGGTGVALDDEPHREAVAFEQSFVIGTVEVAVEAESLAPSHEVWLESPAGTEVRLSAYDPRLAPYATEAGIDATFAARGAPYAAHLLAGGALVAPIGPGGVADFEGEPSTGFQPWTLRYIGLVTLDDWCVRLYPAAGEVIEVEFLRGDANGNGTVTAILDALYLLQYAFLGGPEPPCMDAADVDGNGIVAGLLDALYLLQWAFLDGAAPPAPGPYDCGPDPNANALECLAPPPCS